MALSPVPPRKRRSHDESSSTELVTHKSEQSPDRPVLAGDDAPSMGDFSAACNHGTGRNPRRLRTGNSEVGPSSRCSLQLKPCSVFIVAAIPIPTEPSLPKPPTRVPVKPWFQCQSTTRHSGSRTQGLVPAVELYQTGSYPRTKVVITIGGYGPLYLSQFS